MFCTGTITVPHCILALILSFVYADCCIEDAFVILPILSIHSLWKPEQKWYQTKLIDASQSLLAVHPIADKLNIAFLLLLRLLCGRSWDNFRKLLISWNLRKFLPLYLSPFTFVRGWLLFLGSCFEQMDSGIFKMKYLYNCSLGLLHWCIVMSSQ